MRSNKSDDDGTWTVMIGNEMYVRRKVSVSFKEGVLVSLALLLLVTSLCLFYKNWKKNYRDINQLPYYSYMYKDESPEAPPRPVVVAAAAAGSSMGSSLIVNKSRSAVNWGKAARAVAIANKFQPVAGGAVVSQAAFKDPDKIANTAASHSNTTGT